MSLARESAPPVHQLYMPELVARAEYELTDSNLPESASAPVWIERPVSGRKVQMMPLPVPLDGDARQTIGTDLKITADGRPLRYASLGGGPDTWRVIKDRLEIKVRNAQKLVIEYSPAGKVFDSWTLSGSGGDPAAFVVSENTWDGDTRQGLRLTSPSTATWSLTLPEGASFTASPSLFHGPVHPQKSDGLKLHLEVAEGDSETFEAAGQLDVATTDAAQWKVDLAKWAGKQVRLRLRTEVTGTPELDYVFIGAPTVVGAPKAPVRRVLVIGFDTTRPDHLSWYGYGKNTTPELDAIANSSAVFTNAWTPAPRTRPSFRSATTGRYPLDAVGATNIGEVFQQNGFATAGFVANIHLQPRFDFHEGFDRWLFDGRADADEQVDRALAFFEQNANRDSYAFLHFMDPHLLYHAPAPYTNVFVDNPDPGLPRAFTKTMVGRWGSSGELTDVRKAHIQGLYDGELKFTSAEVGRLIQALDTMPGETFVVFHSDHGEEFWEHGGFEHNHTLYDEVTRGLLWFRPPGGTQGGAVVSEQPSTLADIAPTLYDYLGFTDLPDTDGISLRPFIEGKPPTSRDIGIAHLRHGEDRWGVVHRGHKYIVFTEDGREQLFKLPDEHADLAANTDLVPYRKALLGAHPGLRGGLGWRVRLQDMSAFELQLPQAAVAAGVYSPNDVEHSRANLAWGEPPRKTVEDVGSVTLSDDRKTLSFEPGNDGTGLAWVLFEADVATDAAQLKIGDTTVPYPSAMGYVGATGAKMRIMPGMLVVPPPGEAARMNALRQGTDVRTDEETCRLCELGYIEGEACKACE